MASAKQIAWRKKFARMSKAGVFRTTKKGKARAKETAEYLGNIRRVREADKKYAQSLKKSKSSSNPHGKTESIAQLEKKLDMMLQKGGFDIHGNFKAKYDPQFLAGIEKLQKLKRK